MKVPNPPLYHEAAELVTERLWRCRVCGKAWSADRAPGGTFDAEAAARYCHTGQRECDAEGCRNPTEPFRTVCSKHLARIQADRWAKRKRVPYGGGPVFSDTLDEWFESLDDAEDTAAARVTERVGIDHPDDVLIHTELEEMRLRAAKPVYARTVDLVRFVEDELPDDEDAADRILDRLNALQPLADALNKALAGLGPISWVPGDEAIDLDARTETPTTLAPS